MTEKPKLSQVELFRRTMPKQFTKLTKFCAKCGLRVRWDNTKHCYTCHHCKAEY